jgi:uncharacterized MAPEG superfamily protein
VQGIKAYSLSQLDVVFKRAIRAHGNMLENLPRFSVLAVVAVLAGETNQLPAWAGIAVQ